MKVSPPSPAFTSLHLARSHTCTHSFFTLIRGGEPSKNGKSESNAATPTALAYMNAVVSHSFLNRLWDGGNKTCSLLPWRLGFF